MAPKAQAAGAQVEETPRARARATYVRVTPRKARRVIDLIRGLPTDEALTLLRFTPQAASEPIYKVVASAVANAEHNLKLDPETLVVVAAYVDEGPTLKRFRPRAQGRAYRINKRTSHITVEVESVQTRPEPARPARAGRGAAKAGRSAPARAAGKGAGKPAKATAQSSAAPAEAGPTETTPVEASTEASPPEASPAEASTASPDTAHDTGPDAGEDTSAKG